MKNKWAVFLSIVTLFLLATILVPFVVQAQGENLLRNPGFEEGHFNQDGIAEITVPNGWRMHWSNRESNIFNGYAETARPETVVWNVSGAPDNEKDVFWKDGIYTVKIFKGWAPVWAAMSQDVSGLQPGRRYRLVVPIFIDIVADYDGGRKVPPEDGRQGRVRLGVSPVGAAWRDESAIAYSGWWTGENVFPFYQAYPTFIHEFTATAPEMTVWIEMASNYPHPNNGFFIDTVGLYALDEVDTSVQVASGSSQSAQSNEGGGNQQAAPAPTSAPAPTATPRSDGAVVHIVQPGDSFWSLAIQYADTMGITPEEALQVIPEINNNPSVISNGMELIIVPPSADGGQEETEEAAESAENNDQAEANSAADEGESSDSAEPPAEESEVPSEKESAESSIAQALPQITAGSICVQVYEDVDNDGVRAEQGEMSLADQAVTLAQDGNTISTYITDGTEELHCFEDLESGTYQVQIIPTAGFTTVADDSWAIAVADGVMVPVSFGLQVAPQSVADASNQEGDAASAADATAPESQGGSGLLDNMGVVVLAVAGVLILLAGAGIFLLRRG